MFVCLTCGSETEGLGHNPEPINLGLPKTPDFQDRRVCDDCNIRFVIPVQMGAVEEAEIPCFLPGPDTAPVGMIVLRRSNDDPDEGKGRE